VLAALLVAPGPEHLDGQLVDVDQPVFAGLGLRLAAVRLGENPFATNRSSAHGDRWNGHLVSRHPRVVVRVIDP
jgi:hypothetical protein